MASFSQLGRRRFHGKSEKMTGKRSPLSPELSIEKDADDFQLPQPIKKEPKKNTTPSKTQDAQNTEIIQHMKCTGCGKIPLTPKICICGVGHMLCLECGICLETCSYRLPHGSFCMQNIEIMKTPAVLTYLLKNSTWSDQDGQLVDNPIPSRFSTETVENGRELVVVVVPKSQAVDTSETEPEVVENGVEKEIIEEESVASIVSAIADEYWNYGRKSKGLPKVKKPKLEERLKVKAVEKKREKLPWDDITPPDWFIASRAAGEWWLKYPEYLPESMKLGYRVGQKKKEEVSKDEKIQVEEIIVEESPKTLERLDETIVEESPDLETYVEVEPPRKLKWRRKNALPKCDLPKEVRFNVKEEKSVEFPKAVEQSDEIIVEESPETVEQSNETIAEGSSKAIDKSGETIVEEPPEAIEQSGETIVDEFPEGVEQSDETIVEESSKTFKQSGETIVGESPEAIEQSEKTIVEESPETFEQSDKIIVEESPKTFEQSDETIVDEFPKAVEQSDKTIVEESPERVEQSDETIVEESPEGVEKSGETIVEEFPEGVEQSDEIIVEEFPEAVEQSNEIIVEESPEGVEQSNEIIVKESPKTFEQSDETIVEEFPEAFEQSDETIVEESPETNTHSEESSDEEYIDLDTYEEPRILKLKRQDKLSKFDSPMESHGTAWMKWKRNKDFQKLKAQINEPRIEEETFDQLRTTAISLMEERNVVVEVVPVAEINIPEISNAEMQKEVGEISQGVKKINDFKLSESNVGEKGLEGPQSEEIKDRKIPIEEVKETDDVWFSYVPKKKLAMARLKK